jgi:hypothetical protein
MGCTYAEDEAPRKAVRHIKTETDFARSQFPDNGGGDGSRNVGIFTIKLFNIADSSRIFYPTS